MEREGVGQGRRREGMIPTRQYETMGRAASPTTATLSIANNRWGPLVMLVLALILVLVLALALVLLLALALVLVLALIPVQADFLEY